MSTVQHYDKTFEAISYIEKVVTGREFEQCTFIKCDFSNSEFTGNKFLDCTFVESNLTMMKLNDSMLNNVVFNNCKIMGVDFSKCDDFLFSVNFQHCVLDYTSFERKKMPKTNFLRCSMKEVNFVEADLSKAVFNDSDLSGAVFDRTQLQSSNFSNAVNYALDPELNKIQRATFSQDGLAGLLLKYKIKVVGNAANQSI